MVDKKAEIIIRVSKILVREELISEEEMFKIMELIQKESYSDIEVRTGLFTETLK